MPGDEQLSAATFTKRVDHDARRRDAGNPSESLVCEQCGVVYIHTFRASTGSRAVIRSSKWPQSERSACPACAQAEEGFPGGYVYIDGDFLSAHREDLQRMIRNEARRASEDNPLSRIVRIDNVDRDRLTVETTTEQLARRLGRALERDYGGYARYGLSHQNKPARVWWHRD